jgi:hypothetical protein
VRRASLDRGGELSRVALVLLAIGLRERDDRAVEDVAGAEVGGDRDPAAAARVRARPPRKMSLVACISRCPATTRSPWLASRLAPSDGSSADASASSRASAARWSR